MASIVWTEPALKHLEAIFRYIAGDSVQSASRAIDRINASTSRLEDMPLSVRLLPERPDGRYREVIEPPYRIAYRYDEQAGSVFIIAVAHSKQRMSTLLRSIRPAP